MLTKYAKLFSTVQKWTAYIKSKHIIASQESLNHRYLLMEWWIVFRGFFCLPYWLLFEQSNNTTGCVFVLGKSSRTGMTHDNYYIKSKHKNQLFIISKAQWAIYHKLSDYHCFLWHRHSVSATGSVPVLGQSLLRICPTLCIHLFCHSLWTMQCISISIIWQ